jgi:tripartite-type tricarboxylate transporter receptor subunit TctC
MIGRTLASLILCSTLFHGAAAQTQPYPNKPIRIIVPYAVGGGLDVLARQIGDGLSIRWKQPVTVENRIGAAGNIGAELVYRAPPDGYTVLITTEAPLAVNKGLYKNLPFDPARFVPVSIMTSAPLIVTVNPSLQIRTVNQFIDYAKANPGKLTYGSAGIGGSSHLSVALFEMMAGVRFNHVPYKGMAPATADMIAGHVNFVFGFESGLGPYFNSDKVVFLAVTSEERLAALPKVPTVAEVLPGYVVSSWFAAVLPPQTPAEIANELYAGIDQVLRSTEVRKRIQQLGQVILNKPPAEARAFLQRETEQWAKVVRATGASVD